MINAFSHPGRANILRVFIVLYALLSIYTILEFIIVSHFGDSFRWVQLNAMVHGNACRPFVYRVLVPKIIELIVYLTPANIHSAANIAIQNSFLPRLLDRIAPGMWVFFSTPDLLYVRILMVMIVYGFLWAYIAMLYKLAHLIYPKLWSIALFAPIVGMLMIIGFSHPVLYVYDFSLLFLSASCFYFLKKQDWKWYFICFFFACLNKETAIFSVFFYGLWFAKRLPQAQFMDYGKIQILIYLVVKLFLYMLYKNNPGPFLEYHPDLQARLLFSGCTFVEMTCYLTIIFLLVYRWHEKPLFARYVLWLVPVMYIAYFNYGYPGEYRVFFDLFPLLTLLVTDTLVIGTGIAKAVIFRPSS